MSVLACNIWDNAIIDMLKNSYKLLTVDSMPTRTAIGSMEILMELYN